jgi:toxin ParE1/3/4
MKTYRVVFSRGMSEDVMELEYYITIEASREIAENFVDGLVEECESLWLAPYRGTKRRYLKPNMRIIGFKHAVAILYRIEEVQQLVVFLGISYRGRSIKRILERNE